MCYLQGHLYFFLVNSNKTPTVSACGNLHLKQANDRGRDHVPSACSLFQVPYTVYNLGVQKEKESKDLKNALNNIVQLATKVS